MSFDPRSIPEMRQGPVFIRDAFNQLREGLVAVWPYSSDSVLVTDVTGGGKNFRATRGRGVNGEDVQLIVNPFDVYLRQLEDETWERAVSPNSRLFDQIGVAWDDLEINITGCASSDPPADDDDGWAPIVAGDRIWLEIGAFAPWPTPGTASIRDDTNDSDWNGGEIEYQYEGGADFATQYKGRMVIATVEDEGSGLVVKKLCTSHRRIATAPGTGRDSSGESPLIIPAVVLGAY